MALMVLSMFSCVEKEPVYGNFPGKDVDFTYNVDGDEYTLDFYVVSTIKFNNTSSKSGSVTWDFGDGTNSNEDNPSHTYTQTGSFDVMLTVVDSYGCQTVVRKNDMVEIGTFLPNCVVPEQVCLNATTIFRSDLDEADCMWDFGDGSPLQYEPNASHTYSQTGTYSVSFTFDPNGPCRQTQVFSIEVVDVQASFRTEPEDLFSCSYPFNVRFISTSVGENLTYTYNFDDTYLGMDENMTHSYSQNGRYTPTLTVSSPGGCTGPSRRS